MTSKQRSYLKSLANSLEPIFQIGKSSLTPEFTAAVAEAFNTRELVKVAVLKNCMDDPKEIAEMLAGRTRSQVVQVIGRKIILYKESKENKKIILPQESFIVKIDNINVFFLRGDTFDGKREKENGNYGWNL